MNPSKNKRQVDFHALLSGWAGQCVIWAAVEVLLEYLKQKNQVYGVGVDIDFQDIKLYQARGECLSEDIKSFLNQFSDNSFDHVILIVLLINLKNLILLCEEFASW